MHPGEGLAVGRRSGPVAPLPGIELSLRAQDASHLLRRPSGFEALAGPTQVFPGRGEVALLARQHAELAFQPTDGAERR